MVSPDISSLSKRVQVGCCVQRKYRSGWGIKPNTNPLASQIPITSPTEPLGLSSLVYRHAIWSFSSSRCTTSSLATKRPSPCAIGMQDSAWLTERSLVQIHLEFLGTSKLTHLSIKRAVLFYASAIVGTGACSENA